MDKWSEYQEYIQQDTVREEENYNNILFVFRCFCTLTWKTQYFLVLCDNILLISDDPCYNYFSLIKDACEIFEDKIELFKNKIYKEIEEVIVKDTYSKGKNAGLRKTIAFLKDMNI
jgi:hypothetical protein